MNPGNADFPKIEVRYRMRRKVAVILSVFGLIGIGLVVKSRLAVVRPMLDVGELNQAEQGGIPDPGTGAEGIMADTRGDETGIVIGAALGKRIFEQSNALIKLSILTNGTYQVSMPGRPGEFRTWEGQKPLDTGNHFKVPAGIFIKIRDRAGEILGGGWHTPLNYSSSIFMPIFGHEKLIDAVGDSGLVELSDLTAFLGNETHKLPEFSDLEFKLLVKPSVMMLFKPDGSPISEVDVNDIETGWISGHYLTKLK